MYTTLKNQIGIRTYSRRLHLPHQNGAQKVLL
ncbi:MAG: hypothetical protein ACJA19_000054 [Bacteroidia bacterium]|jgi:hypothetical protein